MVIKHNLGAMNHQRILTTIGGKKGKAMEKLTSGYQINRSADDAAGLAISEKMRKQNKPLKTFCYEKTVVNHVAFDGRDGLIGTERLE